MHKTIRTFLIVALTLTAARAYATPATCTVSNIDIFTTLVPFPHVGGAGLAIPVDIEAATGQITMDRSTYTAAFPSPGLEFDTGFGSIGWLDWDPGPITGTMDSDGQITFLHFGMHFFTDFATPGQASLAGNLDTTFSTAMQARPVSGTAYLFPGAALNSAGQVTLSGADLVNFVAVLQTGPRLSCTLSPAVDLASLPKGPVLTSVKGQVKAGPDPTAADDDLTLTAVMTAGAVPAVLDGTQDVLLRLQPAGQAAAHHPRAERAPHREGQEVPRQGHRWLGLPGDRRPAHQHRRPDAASAGDQGRLPDRQEGEEAEHVHLQGERDRRVESQRHRPRHTRRRNPGREPQRDLHHHQEGAQVPLSTPVVPARRQARDQAL